MMSSFCWIVLGKSVISEVSVEPRFASGGTRKLLCYILDLLGYFESIFIRDDARLKCH